MMTFASDPAGPCWLLDHGADPNLAWGQDNEAPLHVAARRWDVPMVEALIAHGADALRRRADGCTPYALAQFQGNQQVSAWLAAQGASAPAFASRAFRRRLRTRRSRGRPRDARRPPEPADELGPEHHLMLARHAESGNAQVLETMLACGFDPHARRTRTASPLSIARQWQAIRRRCGFCCGSARTSTRSTACSRPHRSCGPWRDAATACGRRPCRCGGRAHRGRVIGRVDAARRGAGA